MMKGNSTITYRDVSEPSVASGRLAVVLWLFATATLVIVMRIVYLVLM